MSNEKKNGKPAGNISDPEKLQDMLRSDKKEHQAEAIRRMDEQAQKAYNELQRQSIDLFCQVLGYMPTPEQRKKHGKVDKTSTGALVYYWNGEAVLKLSPVKARAVLMRVGDKKQKIKFSQDYETLKDDPDGYKLANPDDSYVVNNYPED